MVHFRTQGKTNCIQKVDLQSTNMAPMIITWLQEERFLEKEHRSLCKPSRVQHNQNQERDTNRRSEEAKDLNLVLW